VAVRRTSEQPADERVDDVQDEDEYRDDEEAPALSAAEAGRVALRHISELTMRDPVGVTSVEPTDDGWTVAVEVVEQNRVPSSSDMLGLYSVDVDLDGMLLSYRRTQRYPRGSSDRLR
jgi:hypothetical protein